MPLQAISFNRLLVNFFVRIVVNNVERPGGSTPTEMGNTDLASEIRLAKVVEAHLNLLGTPICWINARFHSQSSPHFFDILLLPLKHILRIQGQISIFGDFIDAARITFIEGVSQLSFSSLRNVSVTAAAVMFEVKFVKTLPLTFCRTVTLRPQMKFH